jgi:hypothetical protein
MYLNTAWSYCSGWSTRTKKGEGPPRRNDPHAPYDDSVSEEGSHWDVDLLKTGGLLL